MKKRLITAVMAIAALSAAAAAQDQGDDRAHDGGGHQGGAQAAAPRGGRSVGPAGGAMHDGPPAQGPAAVHRAGPTGGMGSSFGVMTHDTNAHRAPSAVIQQDGGAATFGGQAHMDQGHRSSGRPANDGNTGRRFTYQGQAHAAIRGSSFHYPNGYSYRRWSTGQRLPMLFLTARYFFDDYSDYGFGPPPFGDRWVRYGPDLLLVDIRSGQVVDVIYGAFY